MTSTAIWFCRKCGRSGETEWAVVTDAANRAGVTASEWLRRAAVHYAKATEGIQP